MTNVLLTFGHACPQHPLEPIERVTCEPVEVRGTPRWLVTATYRCGHRHTQYAPAPPATVLDTESRTHAVSPP